LTGHPKIPIAETNITVPRKRIKGSNWPKPYPDWRGLVINDELIGPIRMLPMPFPNAIIPYTELGSSDIIEPNFGQRTTYPPANQPYINEKESNVGRDEA
jgi:hypothetical protein